MSTAPFPAGISIQEMNESYAESVATFRSTPDSSADDQDCNIENEESLHGIDIEESLHTVHTVEVEQAVVQLGGGSSSAGSGLPPRPNTSNTSSPISSRLSKSPKPPKMNSRDQRTLSKVSRTYDRNNKGFLDPYERQMRELDKSNQGHLSNDTVYDILKQNMEVQKKMVTQRWLIVGLAIFAAVLALANMGTAFAAARLAKDTEITSTGDLASKYNHERVGTTAKGYTFELDNAISNKPEEDDGSGEINISGGSGRRLGLGGGMLNYHLSSFNTISRSKNNFMHMLLTSPALGSPTLVRLNWNCGKDGLGAQMSGIVSGVEKLPYTNAAGTAYNGTLYTYNVKVLYGEDQTVAVDCVDIDGVDECIVDGTNCCMTNSDCGAGTKCMSCGCQCRVDNGHENRCDSSCEFGKGEPVIFRP